MNSIKITDLNGQAAILHTDELNSLKDKVKGDVIFPDSTNYEEARKVWNGLIDKRPAVIVQVLDNSDVLAAINFAIKNKIPISARGGGHNVSGSCMIEEGMVLDFSNMKKIVVDIKNQEATVQAGASWGDLDYETQKYGLATPGGVVSDTGIAGLTLGGGYGWIRRKYGLSCDNIISAEIVSGTGELLQVSELENPDLFWAIRGGGGNFGIVTSFTFKLHKVGPELYMSLNFYPLESAKETLTYYKNFVATAKEEINSFAIYGSVPPYPIFPKSVHGKPIVLLAACFSGSVEDGKRELESFQNYGKPILNVNQAMSYLDIQKLFDEDYPHGRLYYWKSIYFSEITEEVSSILAEYTSKRPSILSTMDIWHMGGAIRSHKEGAFPNREHEFMLAIEANWTDKKDSEKNIAWARDLYKAMLPYGNEGSYLNFPGFFEEGVNNIYGENQASVEKIKAKYDPNHLLRLHK
jgi:FAD/FMN-containing dehydrogenase